MLCSTLCIKKQGVFMENEIFNEIDEEVRQDKIIKFISNNKKTLLGSVAAIALAIMLIATYISNKKQEAELYTAKLVSLFFNINVGNNVEREVEYIINNAPRKISDFAKLILCSDDKKSCSEMMKIYLDRTSDHILRYVAFLGYIFRRLCDNSCNKIDVLHELDKVLSEKDVPFKLIFLELKGYVLLEVSDYDAALKIFEELLNEKSITDVMKNRINFIIDYIKSVRN